MEEANIRRGRSFDYNCSVAGFSANGELWEPGRLVSVKDTEKGVVGLFQTSTIRWSWGGDGENVNIEIAYPDKGLVTAELPSILEKTTQESTTYIVKQDDTLSEIAENLGVKLSELASLNPQIENIDLIYPDQSIRIPVTGGYSDVRLVSSGNNTGNNT